MPRKNRRRERMRDEEARYWQERELEEDETKPIKTNKRKMKARR
jgi:hypothetical protein